jgi:magnesium transporter
MALRRIDVVLESVRRLLRLGATPNLLNLLLKQHPADLAEILTELTEKDRHTAFNALVERNSKLAMETVSELGPEKGAELLALRPADEIARLIQLIPHDDAASLLDQLPDELSSAALDLIKPKPGVGVTELLEYPEKTAGRLMNPNVFALSEDLTAGEAITALQTSRDVEMVFYLYVVDSRRHLVGVVSLRRLLLVTPDTPLKRIMTVDVYSARVDTDQEEVAKQVASYNLLALPIVDAENKLIGLITVDDVIDVMKEEATEDVLRLAGVSADDSLLSTPIESFRKRMPWLQVNLLAAFVAAYVVGLFTKTIKAAPIIAAYMPVVAGMGGNAATQTLAIVVRAIALGELTWTNARQAVIKESIVGLGNGIATGLVGALLVWMTSPGHDWVLGLILGLAMVINMFVAAAAGTLIPLALRALKVDPALASSVLITTLTDVFGFFSFLGLSTLLLRFLHAG